MPSRNRRRKELSVPELLALVRESMEMPEGVASRANAQGQLRRRGRMMKAALSLLGIKDDLGKIETGMLMEQVRKQSRAIRKLCGREP
jgi:hypothetical protein